MQRRIRKKLKWIVCLLAAAAVFCAAIGWLMFQHIPHWYRPPKIARAELQAVRDDMTATLDGLNESLVKSNEIFEYPLNQDQINAWLAIREEIWPGTRTWLPDSLSHPFIVIDPKGIRLAATYQHGKLSTVVSTRLNLKNVQDGLQVQISEVSAGSLPIPKSLLKNYLSKIDHTLWPAGKNVDIQYHREKLPPLSNLFQGIVLPDAWIWNSRPFRIINVKLKPQEVVVTYEPLPRYRSSRRHSQ